MECSDVIWQRGLLRKGYGICHGTSGNGYSFLSLYHLTQDKKYLYRACKVRTPLSLQLWNFPGQSPTAQLLFPLWACPSQSVVKPVSSVTSLSLVFCPIFEMSSKHKGYSEDQKFRDHTAWSELLYYVYASFMCLFWRVWASAEGLWFCCSQRWPRTLIFLLLPLPSSRVSDLWCHTQLIYKLYCPKVDLFIKPLFLYLKKMKRKQLPIYPGCFKH